MIKDCATENPDIDLGERLLMTVRDCLVRLLQESRLRENLSEKEVDDIWSMTEELRTKIPPKLKEND